MKKHNFDVKFNLKIIFIIISLIFIDLNAVLEPTLKLIVDSSIWGLQGGIVENAMKYFFVLLALPSLIAAFIFFVKYANSGIISFFETAIFFTINMLFSIISIFLYFFARNVIFSEELFIIASALIFLIWIYIPYKPFTTL